MARGPLMLRPPPLPRLLPLLRLMLMLSMATTDTPMPMDMVLATTDMPTTDTTDMLIPMPTSDTTARGLLMLRLPPLLRLMLMLTTATTATPAPTPTDTVDSMATPTAMDMATTDKM